MSGSGALACRRSPTVIVAPAPSATPSTSAAAAPAVVTTVALAQASAVPTGPLLASIQLQTWVYAEPRRSSTKLGYLRAGAIVGRAEKTADNTACPGGWYAIRPFGYVCVGEQATLDLEHPIVRATRHRRPDLTKPMPYRYGFIRSVAPQYLKVPTKEEQLQYEFKLENHLKWYGRHEPELNVVTPGANDVSPEQQGAPVTSTGGGVAGGGAADDVDDKETLVSAPGARPGGAGDTGAAVDAGGVDASRDEARPSVARPSDKVSLLELFGADGPRDTVPWWLAGPNGERQIPHLSSFVAPKYAVIAGRVRRHTGLAFIGAFDTGPESLGRKLAITTDLRLLPISKLKPNVGSQWHGVELRASFTLPIAFAHPPKERRSIKAYRIDGGAPVSDGELAFRQAVALTGKDKTLGGTRYFEMKDGRWLKKSEIVIARKPDEWPTFAKGSQKWIDLSVMKQTLVLWEGDKPVFATLVSTGQDGIGDPKTTKSTVRGVFHIRDKHVTTTMDANEVGNKFELRDVPWVEYFEAGYALHAAYWHDEYGAPRSHGCVNMSPIDARRVFFWTDPQLPPGWHGVLAGDDAARATIINSHI